MHVNVRSLSILGAAALALGAVAAASSPKLVSPAGAQSNGIQAPVKFTCTGSRTTYTVPAGVTRLRVFARGASGSPSSPGANDGAAGASISALLTVTPGAKLDVAAGCAGNEGGTGASGTIWAPGGAGGFGYYLGGNGGQTSKLASDTTARGAGGGGGASGIGLGGRDLLVAGGGGGWGADGHDGSKGGGGAGNAGDGSYGTAKLVYGIPGAPGGLGRSSANAGGKGMDAQSVRKLDGEEQPMLGGGGGGGGGGVKGGGGAYAGLGSETVVKETNVFGVTVRNVFILPGGAGGGGGGGGRSYRDSRMADDTFTVSESGSGVWISTAPAPTATPKPSPTATPMPVPAMTAALYRLSSPKSDDYLLTTSTVERDSVVNNLGWSARGIVDGIVAHVSAMGQIGLVPLYRLYSNGLTDHFFTTSVTERDNVTKNLGYTLEGIAGYISPTAQTGLVPLYRLYWGTATAHFYTTSDSERDYMVRTYGYTYEGIAGYVAPAVP